MTKKIPDPDPVRAYLSNIGKKGGSKTSPSKTRAVQENGKKGGRPKKPIPPPESD